jgi:hypothetical protein
LASAPRQGGDSYVFFLCRAPWRLDTLDHEAGGGDGMYITRRVGRSVEAAMGRSLWWAACITPPVMIVACRGQRSPCLPPLFLFDSRRDFGSPGVSLDVGRACACVATRAWREGFKYELCILVEGATVLGRLRLYVVYGIGNLGCEVESPQLH